MGLTSEGIIFLVLAWGIIIALVVFCFYKVFRTEQKR